MVEKIITLSKKFIKEINIYIHIIIIIIIIFEEISQ